MESPDKSIRRIPVDRKTRDRVRGCLLGGAVGDALGAPVEFMERSEIVARFGEQGIRDYAPAYGRLGAITDDTQMSLFTAEGMLRGWVRYRFYRDPKVPALGYTVLGLATRGGTEPRDGRPE